MTQAHPGQLVAESPDSFARKCSAWGVHLLTATGAVAGLMALIAIADHRWLPAFAWMGLTLAIDSVDGSLARACSVKQVLPYFNGELLDNIVDYFNYVIVPAFFLYEAPLVPEGYRLVSAALITVASGYQFCQTDAKTQDHCFKGFPSYWNVVVFYLFMLPFPTGLNLTIVLMLAIAVFIPTKYLYPSRTPTFRFPTLALTTAWGILMLAVLLRYPQAHEVPLYLSLLYVAYYAAMSAYLTFRERA